MRKLLNLMESVIEEDSYARHGDPDEPESYLSGEKFVGEETANFDHAVFDAFSDLSPDSDQQPIQVGSDEYVFLGHDNEEYTIFTDGDDFEVIDADGRLVIDSKRFMSPIQALKNRIYKG